MEIHLLADEREVRKIHGAAGTRVAAALAGLLVVLIGLAGAIGVAAGAPFGIAAGILLLGLWGAALIAACRDDWHREVTLVLTDRRLLGWSVPVLWWGRRRQMLYRLVELDAAAVEPVRWGRFLNATRLVVSTGDGWDDLGLVPDDRAFLRALQQGIAGAKTRLERRREELPVRPPRERKVVRR